jgi:hypothetical protein
LKALGFEDEKFLRQLPQNTQTLQSWTLAGDILMPTSIYRKLIGLPSRDHTTVVEMFNPRAEESEFEEWSDAEWSDSEWTDVHEWHALRQLYSQDVSIELLQSKIVSRWCGIIQVEARRCLKLDFSGFELDVSYIRDIHDDEN